MLPDVVRPGGIGKAVVTRFGGLDLRPDAEDWTLMDTENMTPEKWPRLAAREPRPASDTSPDPVTHSFRAEQFFSSLLGMDEVLISVRNDGYIFYNDWFLCEASKQTPEVRLCRFGRKIIILHTREIINLEWPLLGRQADESDLPGSPEDGDAWVVGDAEDSDQHIWRYESGAWVDKGLLMEPLEAEIEVTSPLICGTTYQGADADMNTIWADVQDSRMPGVPFDTLFHVGDAVTVSGCTRQPRNNQTYVIREISEDKLIFYENVFHGVDRAVYRVGNSTRPEPGTLYKAAGYLQGQQSRVYFELPAGTELQFGDELEYCDPNIALSGWLAPELPFLLILRGGETIGGPIYPTETYDQAAYPAGGTELIFEAVENLGEGLDYREQRITIRRVWPELDGVFEHSNRLWGWKGQTIYASNLGDAANWFRYDGLADDGWSVTLQRPEPITGGISVHGLPTFYTEERRFQVYGSAPSEYQLAEQDCHGVRRGCAGAMAVVDGVLYYPSRFGIMADSGAIPESCSQALGELRLTDAAGGGFGHEYWISGVADGQNERFAVGDVYTLIYDNRSGIWIRDGEERFLSFAAAGGRFFAVQEAETGQPNPLIVLHGDSPWQGFFVEEGLVAWRLLTNVFTQEEPNRKRVHRIQLRAELGDSAELTIRILYDSGGTWETVWAVDGTGVRRSWYLPVLIRRCDHFQLLIEGTGPCVIHSLALETRKGSAIF